MQLLSQISRKYKNKEYEKYWIVLPKKSINTIGWKKGQELDYKITQQTIIITKKRGEKKQ